MLQIVYISTAREPRPEDLLESVLLASRRNNEMCGITGLLVTGGRRFLQVLEGPQAAVLRTYARIAADPRHCALVILSQKTVDERSFGDWAMACEAGGEGAGATDLRSQVEALVAPLDDRNLRAQFMGFAEIHDRSASSAAIERPQAGADRLDRMFRGLDPRGSEAGIASR